jgi:hypothetical protein
MTNVHVRSNNDHGKGNHYNITVKYNINCKIQLVFDKVQSTFSVIKTLKNGQKRYKISKDDWSEKPGSNSIYCNHEPKLFKYFSLGRKSKNRFRN